MTKWMDIETAPTDGTAVLLHVPDLLRDGELAMMPKIAIGVWSHGQWLSDYGNSETDYGEDGGVYYSQVWSREVLSPSKWMALPEPPPKL